MTTPTLPEAARPLAWLCELMQEDGTTRTQIVTEDPEGLRWGDAGEPSPFKVTPLYALSAPADVPALPAVDEQRSIETHIWTTGQLLAYGAACRAAGVQPAPEKADPATDWPIARLTVAEDDSVTATMYAPGLPPGQHDVWCVPVAQPAPDAQPVAWRYDEAQYGENDVRGRCWRFNVLSQHKPTMEWMVQNVTPLYASPVAQQAAEPAAQQPKSLDDPRLQELFGWAIDGAMAQGAQGRNPPPAGHWLTAWWERGRTLAAQAAAAHAQQPAPAAPVLTPQQLDALIERHVGGVEISDDTYSSMVTFARAVLAAAGIGTAPTGGEQRPDTKE